MKLTIRIDDKEYIEPIKDKDELLDKVVEYSAIFIPEDDQLISDLIDLRDFDGVAYHIAECYGNKEPYTSNGKEYSKLLKELYNIKYLEYAKPILYKLEELCKKQYKYFHLYLDISNAYDKEERKEVLFSILSNLCNNSSIMYDNCRCIKLYRSSGKVCYVSKDRQLCFTEYHIENYNLKEDFPLIREICDDEEFRMCESAMSDDEYTYSIMKIKEGEY